LEPERAQTNGEGGDSDDLVTLPEFYLNLSRTSWYKLCTSHLLEGSPSPGRFASAISDIVFS